MKQNIAKDCDTKLEFRSLRIEPMRMASFFNRSTSEDEVDENNWVNTIININNNTNHNHNNNNNRYVCQTYQLDP